MKYSFLYRIQNIGVSKNLPSEYKKRIRLVNSFSMIAGLMAISIISYGLCTNWLWIEIVSVIGLGIIIPITLILTALQRYTLAQHYFFISSCSVIAALTYLYGTAVHFQYYLFLIVGLPVLIYSSAQRIKCFVISAIATLLWAFIEWKQELFTGVFLKGNTHIELIRVLNDLLIFFTLFTISYLWSLVNDAHLNKLRKTQKNLEIRQEELKQTSLFIAHQLKSPHTTIEGLNDLLIEETEGKIEPELRQMLYEIKNTVQISKSVLDALVSYSSLGINYNDNEVFEVENLITSTYKILSQEQDFNLEITSKLPRIHGGFAPLKIIFYNIIDNATRYNNKTNKRVNVKHTKLANGFIKFTIEDNGPGIDPKTRDKLFKLFESFHITQHKSSPKGMGLAVAKKLILEVGGKYGIEPTSELDGTAIYFTWPVYLNTSLSKSKTPK